MPSPIYTQILEDARAAFVSLRKIAREGKAAAAAKIGLPKSKPRRK